TRYERHAGPGGPSLRSAAGSADQSARASRPLRCNKVTAALRRSRRGECRLHPRRRPALSPGEELEERVADVIDLGGPHLGEHRQAQNLARRTLRHWECPVREMKMAI